MNITQWLKQKLDIFELRVRAGKQGTADSVGHDIYWCAGWADGYKAAQRDARRAAHEIRGEAMKCPHCGERGLKIIRYGTEDGEIHILGDKLGEPHDCPPVPRPTRRVTPRRVTSETEAKP